MKKSIHLRIVTGFGDKGAGELKKKLDETLSFESSKIIPTVPWYKAFKSTHKIIDDVSSDLDEVDGDVLLVGQSFGAFIAMLVAFRRQMERILKLILIDGPLASRVHIKPKKFAHKIFRRHYNAREELARECEALLEEFSTDKLESIITIGAGVDKIVHPKAKLLVGEFETFFTGKAEDVENIVFPSRKGLNVLLQHIKYHGIVPKNTKNGNPFQKIEDIVTIMKQALEVRTVDSS